MNCIIVDLGTGDTRAITFAPNGALPNHPKISNEGLFLPGKPHWKFDAQKLAEIKDFTAREIRMARHLRGENTPIRMVATQGVRNLSKADRTKFCKLFSIPGVANLQIISGEKESRLYAEAICAGMPGVAGLSVHTGRGSIDVAQIQENGKIPVSVTRPDGLKAQRSDITPIIHDPRITCSQGGVIFAGGSVFSKLADQLCEDEPVTFVKGQKFYHLRLARLETIRDDFSADDFEGNKDKLYALNIVLGFAERFGSSGIILPKVGWREGLAARVFKQMAVAPANRNMLTPAAASAVPA